MSLEKAEEFLNAAELCLQNEFPNASASRSYYSMFHAAIVALETVKISKEKWGHDELQSFFVRELIHRRKIYPSVFKRYISDAASSRTTADYKHIDISRKTAKRILQKASEFLKQVKEVNKL